MYVAIGAHALKGVESRFDEVGLGECHGQFPRGFVGCDVPLDTKHESWIAYFYFETFMEFVGDILEVSHDLAMPITVVSMYDDE